MTTRTEDSGLRTEETAAAPVTQSAILAPQSAARYSPRAAVQLGEILIFVGRNANRLAGDNDALVDDLMQEALVAVLETEGTHTLSWFRFRARWAMHQHLRRERREAALRDELRRQAPGDGRQPGNSELGILDSEL